MKVKSESEVAQSCLTLSDPMAPGVVVVDQGDPPLFPQEKAEHKAKQADGQKYDHSKYHGVLPRTIYFA